MFKDSKDEQEKAMLKIGEVLNMSDEYTASVWKASEARRQFSDLPRSRLPVTKRRHTLSFTPTGY